MPKQLINTFTSYELTEEEAIKGAILNELNICVIQNLLSTTAQEKLNLSIDTNNIAKFTQEEAALQGKLAVLYFLLDSHIAATSTLPIVE